MFRYNGRSGNGPCKDCEERYEACHGKCERYKEWKAELDAVNETAKKDKRRFDTMSEASKRELWRSARYSRQQHSRSGKER